MSRWSLSLILAAACAPPPVPPPAPVVLPVASPEQRPTVAPGTTDPQLQQLVTAARQSRQTWARLAALCDGVGHRLAGSPGMVAAEEWGLALFEADGQENVRGEELMVPHWVRGREDVSMVAPWQTPLQVLTLGRSVGTQAHPGGVLEAEVAVVRDASELGPQVEGKIVLWDVVMEEHQPAFLGYAGAVHARGKGAILAAEHGAVGAMVRSMTTRSLATPHTGAMWPYPEGSRQIPAVAVSIENADMMARIVDEGETVRVRMELGAETLPDVTGRNIIAEVRGSEKPDEIVLIGGHLDAWDVGQGAHDDGSGVVESIEALRLIRELGVRPKRTIRAVLFANEENGLRGGRNYAEVHGDEVHVAAIESDLGGGWPLGFSATGSAAQLDWLRSAAAPLGLPVAEGGGGADISPLKKDGVLVVGLRPDDRHYFDVHHTHADTLDKVDERSLREATAAMAGLAWLLANAPEAPERSAPEAP